MKETLSESTDKNKNIMSKDINTLNEIENIPTKEKI